MFAIGRDSHKGETSSVLLKNRNVSRPVDLVAVAELLHVSRLKTMLYRLGCRLDDRRVGSGFDFWQEQMILSSLHNF